jgi:translation initiation factor 2 subunit 3
LVEAITGRLTLTHSEELKRGITIRLGYADATIYRCEKGHYGTTPKCPVCLADAQIQRTVSFVDAPGHETLMATVLTGAALMDAAILVIAANEPCPQPQTREHLTALEAVGIHQVLIVQNKIDLVSEQKALQNYAQIKKFIKGTPLEKSPIIPISAQQRVGIAHVLEAIQTYLPTPPREKEGKLKMLVARSFDVNRPGIRPKELRGGVLGGAIIQGRLRLGDTIEIRPGVTADGEWRALLTQVVGLQKARLDLEEVGPGGLVGVMTQLDPTLTKSDGLVGNVVGLPGQLPPVRDSLSLDIQLLERVVGLKEFGRVKPIRQGETLMINVGTARSVGEVVKLREAQIELKLKIPVCAEMGDKVVISRQIAGRWRLIGIATII